MSAKMRAGHIGCGSRGTSDIESMRGLLDFEMVCDLDPVRAEKTQTIYGFKKATTDWRTLIHDPSVEFISICLPPDLNYEIVMEASHLAKPIWVEKPMDWCLTRAVEMVQVCKQFSTPIAVGQNYRYSDIAMHVKELIGQGEIGEPFFANLEHMFRSDNIFLDWISRSGRYLSSGVCVHYYDLFRFFLDDDADTVYARTFQAPYRQVQAKEKGIPSNNCDTTCIASVAFKKGTVVQLTCSEDIQGGDAYWPDHYTISGSEGSVFVNAAERFPLQIYRSSKGYREPVHTAVASSTDPGKTHIESRRLIADYLAALENGLPAPTSGLDNLKSLAIAEATYLSAESGMPVKVDDLLP